MGWYHYPSKWEVATIVYNRDGNSEFVCVVHMARIFIKGTTALLLCSKILLPIFGGPQPTTTTQSKRGFIILATAHYFVTRIMGGYYTEHVMNLLQRL